MSNHWKLPPLKSGHSGEPDFLARRAQIEATMMQAIELHPEMSHVQRREVTLNGVDGFEVGDPAAALTVLYLHGGGFSLGHPSMWVRYAAWLADEAKVRVVLPRYRLAPENPFPTGLHDALAAYDAVRAQSDGKRLIVMGESAGASLTASLLAAATMQNQPLPDAAILISPLLDMSTNSQTYDSHSTLDPWVSRSSIQKMRGDYLQGHSETDTLVSPLLADVSNFPPIQIHCGGHEVLLGDTLDLVRKLALANRQVELQIAPNAIHGWSFLSPAAPEAKQTMAHISRYISEVKR